MYDQILVALDGSEPSRCAGQTAAAIATATGARVIACHVYGAGIHHQRFSDMEPGLPAKYHEGNNLSELRAAHGRLMDEGFQALSAGYVEEFAKMCRQLGITVESVTTEGRSFVGILKIAGKFQCDLIALGAEGLGAVGNGMLGGTTTRVLHSAACDVLVARGKTDSGPIVAGVDGSSEALRAVDKAVMLGRAMNKPVHLTAAYDPDFHTNVFSTMAKTIAPEEQEKVGLAGQEGLHDEIINNGLGTLYADFLREAQSRIKDGRVTIETFLKTGKAYCALDSQIRESGADLAVVSRYGHHREKCSRLGSNAEGLLRTSSANILLVGGVEDKNDESAADSAVETISMARSVSWDGEAQRRLQRVPIFARKIAKSAVENAVSRSGKDRVTADDFDNIAAKFGMGTRGAD